MALTFGIEIMILFFFYLKKIKLTKKEAIHFVLLTIINIVALIITYSRYFYHIYYYIKQRFCQEVNEIIFCNTLKPAPSEPVFAV